MVASAPSDSRPLGVSAAAALTGSVTADELARRRGVTPAAIRKALRAGTLAGEQVSDGRRTVWRIPEWEAERYLQVARSPVSASEQGVGLPEGVLVAPAVQDQSSAGSAGVQGRPGEEIARRVEMLEGELRRAQRQLAVLADAHRRLLDLVAVD